MLKISSTALMVLVIVFLSGCNTRYVKTTAAVLSAAGVQETDIINSCTDRRNFDQCMASTINYAAERGREENARVAQQTQNNSTNTNSNGVPIIVNNSCPRPIKLAIRYKDSYTNLWKNESWWELSANERITLLTDKKYELRTANAIIYYYAESIDRSNLIWSGDARVLIGNEYIDMRKYTDKDAKKTEILITCT